MVAVEKQKIQFIVNPFSGVGQKRQMGRLVAKYLDQDLFDYDIAYTEAPGHARELALKAQADDYQIVVPVGGDGSVNEVASALIGTDTILGVIPAGSGNGFAMHLGFGRNIARAIRYLNNAKVIKIDTCELNGKSFVNVAGTGFDAWVAYKMKNSTRRGFLGYTRIAIQETVAFQLQRYTIIIDGKKLDRECLTIEVANAQMFGYNMKVAPLAEFDDGLLDVVIIKKVPKWRYFPSMWRFPAGNVHKSRLVEYYKAKEVTIIPERECAVHMDGEGFMSSEPLHFTLKPLSLNVLQPQRQKKRKNVFY